MDHPRMCGKDKVRFYHSSVFSGSPPHVREGPLDLIVVVESLRITPACAGRTGTHTQIVNEQ